MHADIHTKKFTYTHTDKGPSQVVPVVKNPPANAGDTKNTALIPELEDPLEKEMATHSSIPAWRIPWTEEPGGLRSMGSQSDTNEAT